MGRYIGSVAVTKRLNPWGAAGSLLFCLSASASAGGEKAADLVVVADTRVLEGINRYLADIYNHDMWLFAVYAVLFTSLLGVSLGLLMDQIMKRIGIDLGRKKTPQQEQ